MNKVSFLRLNRFPITCYSLFFLTYLFAPTVMADRCIKTTATATSIQGIVEKRQKSDTTWRTVTAQDTFCTGDMVRTRLNSRAAFYLSNNSILRLNELSTVTFIGSSSQNASQLSLTKGIAHFISRLKQRFEVLTPYANAAIDGTEFVITVNTGHSNITVLEGHVRASNKQGTISLTQGESAQARAGEAPALQTRVKPWDAVSWALHYPAVSDLFTLVTTTEELPEPWHSRLRQSFAHYQQGQISIALTKLESLPDDLPNGNIYIYRAALHLATGQAGHANNDLDLVLGKSASQDTTTRKGEALALKTIIAVVQNQTNSALKLAQEATNANSKEPAAWLARSYAQQAVFNLEEARFSVEKAVKLAPKNALAWARLAELRLMFGELDHALYAAHRATELAPRLSHTQSVLGFAYLTRIDIAAAEQAFNQAITFDQSAPLPRLGLGLAMIRRGELATGRHQIEIAASLAPANPLIRSYLGKAYYEEKRGPLDATQFAMAKELDPNDPTPWFYDAIRKRSENNPVGALHDLQQSIKLNNNRVVYRSRLLLDQDAATRSTSQAHIYNDLGFTQMALVEAKKSVNQDPGNHASHRYLADAYLSQPRHEIARVSELLQSQLLQPQNILPIQPQLAESSLGISRGTGGIRPSFNEYDSLFVRNQFSFFANGLVGSNETRAGDIIHSGIYNQVTYSLGRYHYYSNGYRNNNDQKYNIDNAFIQAALTHKANVQFEYRKVENTKGDLTLNFDSTNFSDSRRETENTTMNRIGFYYQTSKNSKLIGSVIKKDLTITQNITAIPNQDISRKGDGMLYEAQHIYINKNWNIISGIGRFKADTKNVLDFDFSPLPCLLPTCLVISQNVNKHDNMYVYSNQKLTSATITVGLSADSVDNETANFKKFYPKIGIQWDIDPTLSLRAALFKTVKRDLLTNQTIEPTQIAGFNQFFDDELSTTATVTGVAVDKEFSRNLFVGAEAFTRQLKVPYIDNIDETENSDWDETNIRSFFVWVPNAHYSFSAELNYEKFKRSVEYTFDFLNLKTYYLPLNLNLFINNRVKLNLNATHIQQNGDFYDTVTQITTPGKDNFWVMDADMQYNIGKRYGYIKIGAKNLLNERFSFQEIDVANPRISRERFVYVKFELNF